MMPDPTFGGVPSALGLSPEYSKSHFWEYLLVMNVVNHAPKGMSILLAVPNLMQRVPLGSGSDIARPEFRGER